MWCILKNLSLTEVIDLGHSRHLRSYDVNISHYSAKPVPNACLYTYAQCYFSMRTSITAKLALNTLRETDIWEPKGSSVLNHANIAALVPDVDDDNQCIWLCLWYITSHPVVFSRGSLGPHQAC